MMKLISKNLIASLFVLIAIYQPAQANEYKPVIDPKQITVSGLSSGAYMAQQIYIAYSSQFQAMGMIAGGEYGCFEKNKNSWWTSLLNRGGVAASWCTEKVKFPTFFGPIDWSHYPDLSQVLEFAHDNQTDGLIDPLSHLAGKKVFLFNSEDDRTVLAKRGETARDFYQELDAIVKFENEFGTEDITYDLAHGIPTKSQVIKELEERLSPNSKGCQKTPPNKEGLESSPPQLYACPDYPDEKPSLIAQMFEHFYGPQNPSLDPSKSFEEDAFIEINQFTALDTKDQDRVGNPDNLKDFSLHKYAYAFIPKTCSDETPCKLHVAFHGCEQYPNKILKGDLLFGDAFYKNIYNHYAAVNNMIVLYPQGHNMGHNPYNNDHKNPSGCWDFWGQFEDQYKTYYTKEARQMKMVMNMVQAFINKEIIVKN